MVHMTAVLRSRGWLKGGFVMRDLHVFLLGLYICTNNVADLLFCLDLRLSVESIPLRRLNMCSSPSKATKPIEDSSVAFLGTFVSFHQRFEDMSYLKMSLLSSMKIPGASQSSAPTHGPFSPRLPGFIDGYPPLLGLSSSEWLYQYRNNHNLEQAYGHPWPVQFNTPGEFGNFHRHDASRFDLFDRWGNPLASNQMVYLDNPQLHQGSSVYGADEQRREKHFLGYQRPSPYGCGVGTDLRAEQPPLLQYLQDREWQLHRESQMRGPTYMGN